MNRKENIQRLQQEHFDLCIIGGGASGAGCALDAALRGLKVALVEREDFAAETSSKSTKLIHGGVRYLEQAVKNLDLGQLRQVRHGLVERRVLLQNAPHLAHPLALITPVFSWLEGLYFSIGLKLYGWFAARRDRLPRSRWISRTETLQRLPGLSRRIHSAVLYYDGQFNDARYCLALAQGAAEAGAAVVNHMQVRGFQKNERGALSAALVEDRFSKETYQVRARVFLNCTGPHADHIRQLANPAAQARIRPSKGVHAVLPGYAMLGREALLIPKTPDGRVVFAVPFNAHLLLGTTDQDHPELEKEPLLESAEIDFLLETLNRYLAQPVDKQQISAGFGGLRPLITAAPGPRKRNTRNLLRDHEVELDPASGLLSLLGGKWTTYRIMARDAVDEVCRTLNISAPCRTENHYLPGGEHYTESLAGNLQTEWSLPPDVCLHLTHNYGARASRVAALTRENPALAERLHPDFAFIQAEVVYAARAEMACTLRDVLARRLRLEISSWNAAHAAAPQTARLLGETLGWPENEISRKVTEYQLLIRKFQLTAQQ